MGSPALARLAGVALALTAATPPAHGGIVFREIETVQSGDPPTTAHDVRQVFADGDNCKVLFEESSDPLIPAGAYVLATGEDAFLIEPATRTMAPLDPSNMKAVAQSSDARDDRRTVRVVVDRKLEEPGPPMLGLPTRHYLYSVEFQEVPAHSAFGQAAVTRQAERHELWVTPLPKGESLPEAWQALRAAGDAAESGAPPREAREVIEGLYQRGLVLREIVERPGPEPEKIVREVTALSRETLSPDIFRRPAGYTPTEFLAPGPSDDGSEEGGEQDGPGAGPGEAQEPAPRRGAPEEEQEP